MGNITYKEFQEALKIVKKYKIQLQKDYDIAKNEMKNISKFLNVTKETKIYNSGLSQRCLNILKGNEDKLGIEINRESKVSELLNLSITKFSECRIAGKMSVDELKELCFFTDIKLLP